MSVLLSLASRAGDFQSPNQQKKLQEHGFPRTNMRQVTRFWTSGCPKRRFHVRGCFYLSFRQGPAFFFSVVVPVWICCCLSVLKHLKRLRRWDRMRLFLDLVNAPRWNLELKLRTLLGTYRVSTYSVDNISQFTVDYLGECWVFRCVFSHGSWVIAYSGQEHDQ